MQIQFFRDMLSDDDPDVPLDPIRIHISHATPAIWKLVTEFLHEYELRPMPDIIQGLPKDKFEDNFKSPLGAWYANFISKMDLPSYMQLFELVKSYGPDALTNLCIWYAAWICKTNTPQEIFEMFGEEPISEERLLQMMAEENFPVAN